MEGIKKCEFCNGMYKTGIVLAETPLQKKTNYRVECGCGISATWDYDKAVAIETWNLIMDGVRSIKEGE